MLTVYEILNGFKTVCNCLPLKLFIYNENLSLLLMIKGIQKIEHNITQKSKKVPIKICAKHLY